MAPPKKGAAPEPALPDYVEQTPKGDKKILRAFDDPYYKNGYDPAVVESAWYEWWEKEKFFAPQLNPDGTVKGKPFVLPHPPPNVTGALHMGHALGDSIQDCLVRWYRMNGNTTLWVPGCDHAGISTQTVVEKMLARRENKTRHDLGREKFVELVWKWKEEYHVRINNALRKLGGSFSWDHEAFTMDENLSAAVMQTFVTLHDEGLIYRANRLVHWCTTLNSALSNLEVEQKELTGRTLLDVPGYEKKVEFGVIVHFQYPIEGSDEKIEVATTRVETMLGDTGIAVHPDDKRYKHLLGKKAVHPFIPGRLLPIVADSYVDMEFGTGAVKLTPAHDHNDFELGKRHNLEFVNIFTDDGKMNENAGPYEGQRRFDVRYSVQADLKEKGLLGEKKDNPMTVPLCERTKTPIEPMLKAQFYMRMAPLAAEAMRSVREGQVKIRPELQEKNFFRWMENITDWNISRQLWWGHRIPCYFAEVEGEKGDSADNDLWFAGKTMAEAEEKAKKKLGSKPFKLVQDEDVFDTWFSSGLWPFSTLGWPNETDELAKYFPTSLLETGWDILTFWICRMMMLSLKLTGKVPFKEVYCHGLVRDSDGRKMSKSLGNVVDPLDVIAGIPLDALHKKLHEGNLNPKEVDRAIKYQKSAFPKGIPRVGADALRFWALAMTTGGSGDILLEINQLHGYRKFSNKIFQATKYVLGKLPSDFVPAKSSSVPGKTLAERWILHKMTMAARDINAALEEREFAKSAGIVYKYWYNFLCDVYIENSKSIIQDGTDEEKTSAIQTLYTTLEAALKMIHPFMPFLSEELWQRLPRREGDSTKTIMLAEYPQYDATLDDAKSESAYERVLGCSRGARSLMSEYSLRDDATIFIQAQDAESLETVTQESPSIKTLSGKGVTALTCLDSKADRPAGCVTYPVSSSLAVFLYVKGRVDMDAEIGKATKKLDKTKMALAKQKKLLADPKYQKNARPSVLEADQQKLADLESEATGFEGTIQQFERLKLE